MNGRFGRFLGMASGRVAAIITGGFLSFTGANAFAYCQSSDPTVGLSVTSPGSLAGVQIGIARISATVTPGSSSGSSYYDNCNSYNSTSSEIYVDNRYLGSGDVYWNTTQWSEGAHRITVYGRDSNGGSAQASQTVFVRNNYVRPEVYDLATYMELNADVANAFYGDANRILLHWLFYGVNEGRQASRTFAAKEYLASYSDLNAAFGGNYSAALNHYVEHGIAEGRAGIFALRSEVFDGNWYLSHNGDLQAAYGGDVNQAKNHWLLYGINEGRQASQNFSSRQYLAHHPEVAAAGDFRGAIAHYVQWGLSAGLCATDANCGTPQTPSGSRTRSLAIQSINGFYFAAEGGGGSNVTVNRTGVSTWETFTMTDLSGTDFNSGDFVNIQAMNGNYFSAECGGGSDPGCGYVNANRTGADTWERFTIVKLGGSDGAQIRSGDAFALRSLNGSYCSAEAGGGDGSILTCNRGGASTWETFRMRY